MRRTEVFGSVAEQAIVIDPRDSVAVALVELMPGQTCVLKVGDEVKSIEIKDKIPFGHKFALRPIPVGENVLKYGEVIGETTAAVEAGGWVHVHNLVSKRGKGRVAQEAKA
jgi:altronate dehydratase small subunit